jgi:hypoxanthine phosphoribosyltransferase
VSILNDDRIDVMISQEQIHARIQELAAQITEEYQGKDLVVIGVLKGSFLFLADLVREIDLPLKVDFLGLSSYGNRTESSGVVRITSDLSSSVLDKHLLIVEDIVDTGLTMNFLLENLRTRKPASIKICSLLEKPARTIQPVDIDYLGFEIEDKFVLGYGLDFEGKFRNLPYIGVFRPNKA